VFTPTQGFGLDSVYVNCHIGGSGGVSSNAPAGDGTFTGTLDTTKEVRGIG